MNCKDNLYWIENIRQNLFDSAETKRLIAENIADKILSSAFLIADCLSSGGKLILFGNGGSAADAQHLAAEFVGRFKLERNALPAMALNTNVSVVTALGNDYGFDEIFARQIDAWARPGDVVMGISTSGESENILRGIEKANSMYAKTIGLTGKDGGRLAKMVDIAIIVPSFDTPRIQEGHIAIGHIICSIVENMLFDGK